jgi:hypothetical protein
MPRFRPTLGSGATRLEDGMLFLWDGETIGRLTDITGPTYELAEPVDVNEWVPAILSANRVTFNLEGAFRFIEPGTEGVFVARTRYRPAWWGRALNAIHHRDPQWNDIEGRGTVQAWSMRDDATAKIEIKVWGPVSRNGPASQAERVWDRLCGMVHVSASRSAG